MIEVIFPWRPWCPHRAAALAWVLRRYRRAHPDWGLRLGKLKGEPWVKAEALRRGLLASSAEIVVVADADVWSAGIESAVEAVRRGGSWALPHLLVHRLTREATAAVLAGAPLMRRPLEREPYMGMVGGGIIVARRETLLEVPLDPRFIGWGDEDRSWGMALRRLFGKPYRGRADLYHLWHPPAPRMNSGNGSEEGKALGRRYAKARRSPAAMRALLSEIGGVNGTAEADQDQEAEPRQAT